MENQDNYTNDKKENGAMKGIVFSLGGLTTMYVIHLLNLLFNWF